MTSIEIKKASLLDLESIQKIGKQTFMETFAAVNTAKNIADYLEKSFNIQQLTFELNHPESQFYLAIFEQEVIGYLKINFGKAQTESINDKALEIHRIYVLKEFHGKKVGQLFINQVMKIVQNHPVEYIWLGVWEENHRAIAFYAKNGFTVFDKHIFTLGDDVQTDLLMKYQIP